MNQFRRILGAAAVSLFAIACAPHALAQDNMVDTIKQRGKLQVGFGSFVPWAMRDKQGQWVGFEVDVATKLAKDMGVQADLMPTAWDGIIPALIANKFDVIIGGLSITPARLEQVDFTEPYSTSGQGLAASKQLASKLKWPEGYNSPDVTFTCRRGAAPCKLIEEKWPKATIRQFDDDAIAFQEVINGNAHAVVSSEPKPTFFTLKNPDRLFKPTDDNVSDSHEGFGLRKGNPAAKAYFNDWIAKNKDWLKERHTYWFKTQDWAAAVPG
ncbi:MAG: transporter substrate-binding domain-containing protein [Variovorax sp.]